MADDDRQPRHGPSGAAGGTPAAPDGTLLPEHASAYFSPRPPPSSTAHQTIETEAVRLDPAIDPDNAPTVPLNVDGLQPPPWLGARLHSDAPTVLVPLVRERRRRRRFFAGIAAALVGVLAGVVYGFTRPLSPDDAAPAQALPHASPTEHPAVVPAAAQAVPANAEPAVTTPPDSKSVASTAPEFAQPAGPPPPIGRTASAPRRVPSAASGARSAWLKSEPPKAWLK